MIIIQQITDSQLLQVYTNNCRAIEIARRCGKITATDGESVSLEQLQLDQDHIMREVNNRLSFDYKWEIDKIKSPPANPSQGIKPGNMYKHLLMAKVQIQIVEDDYNQWSCRLYVANFYLCRVILKQSTILEHFSRLS
jgi:hypothetical protein